MNYILSKEGKFVTLSQDEIKKTFEMLNITITENVNVDESLEWFLDRKPLKVKIQTNTLR